MAELMPAEQQAAASKGGECGDGAAAAGALQLRTNRTIKKQNYGCDFGV
jgi:hypothetical protein